MKAKVILTTIVLLLSGFTGSVFGGTEGTRNTFYGTGAGVNTSGDNDDDTFIGVNAGYSNTTGTTNTFVGFTAGYSNTTGTSNTFVGFDAGYYATGNDNAMFGGCAGCWGTTGSGNSFFGSRSANFLSTGANNSIFGSFAGYNIGAGSGNVFLGYHAGYNETGSNKLYLDNSNTSTPLIYGEFDNNKLTINGNLSVVGPDNGLVHLTNVITNNTTKVSRMVLNHYSNTEEPVYLFGAASTGTNNFVAFGGGNAIGNAATQIDLFTAPSPTTPVGYPRLTIIGNGYVGIGIQDPMYPLEMAGGAYSNGGSWIDGSSREYKDDIKKLTSEEAFEALEGLDPVKYAYKRDRTEKRVGFIAEEVPDLVATKDRKGLSPMDIVAVLTKVVQRLKAENEGLKAKNESLENRLLVIEAAMKTSK
jgi:hypothetical protein